MIRINQTKRSVYLETIQIKTVHDQLKVLI